MELQMVEETQELIVPEVPNSDSPSRGPRRFSQRVGAMFVVTTALLVAGICAVATAKAVFGDRGAAANKALLGESVQLLQTITKNGKEYYNDCGHTYELIKVLHSNLGGHGPDKGDENIVWLSKHMHKENNLGNVEIVMTATKPFKPCKDTSLNGMEGKFGRVALPAGESVTVKYQFRDPETKDLIKLPQLTMTFYDLDQGWEGTAVEFVRVISDHKTFLHDDADIKAVTKADGSVVYTATQLGGRSDNPSKPDELTKAMKKRALAFRIENQDEVEVRFGSSEGKHERGFFFAFMNALNCKLEEVTHTDSTSTGKESSPSPSPSPSPGPSSDPSPSPSPSSAEASPSPSPSSSPSPSTSADEGEAEGEGEAESQDEDDDNEAAASVPGWVAPAAGVAGGGAVLTPLIILGIRRSATTAAVAAAT